MTILSVLAAAAMTARVAAAAVAPVKLPLEKFSLGTVSDAAAITPSHPLFASLPADQAGAMAASMRSYLPAMKTPGELTAIRNEQHIVIIPAVTNPRRAEALVMGTGARGSRLLSVTGEAARSAALYGDSIINSGDNGFTAHYFWKLEFDGALAPVQDIPHRVVSQTSHSRADRYEPVKVPWRDGQVVSDAGAFPPSRHEIPLLPGYFIPNADRTGGTVMPLEPHKNWFKNPDPNHPGFQKSAPNRRVLEVLVDNTPGQGGPQIVAEQFPWYDGHIVPEEASSTHGRTKLESMYYVPPADDFSPGILMPRKKPRWKLFKEGRPLSPNNPDVVRVFLKRN